MAKKVFFLVENYKSVVFVRLTNLGAAICLMLCIEAENLTPGIFTHE